MSIPVRSGVRARSALGKDRPRRGVGAAVIQRRNLRKAAVEPQDAFAGCRRAQRNRGARDQE
jgi:hypothetical protein